MSVDGVAAAQTLLSFRGIKGGYCLHYVWQAYKAHGASTSRNAPTALVGWDRSDGKHPGDWNPPPGVPVWFGAKPGSDAGDVVISLGNGRVAATDYPVYGVVGSCTIAERQRQIARPYLGWSESIFDAPIALAQTASGEAVPISTGGAGDMTAEDVAAIRKNTDMAVASGVAQVRANTDMAGANIVAQLASLFALLPGAVWSTPVQAQDENGILLTHADGSPLTYPASGYLASTNARAGSAKIALTDQQAEGIANPVAEALRGSLVAAIVQASAADRDVLLAAMAELRDVLPEDVRAELARSLQG